MASEIRDCDEKIVRLIASKIIELAMAGEVDPERLCERALNQLRLSSRPLPAAMEKQRAGTSHKRSRFARVTEAMAIKPR
jgi:hypothetical protein